MKRVFFFLNGSRGTTVLNAVLEAGHEVAAACAPPGKAKELGLEALREAHGTELIEVENVNDSRFVTELSERDPTLSVVAGFSTIFRGDLINAPKRGTINLHAGRAPAYRGGSPLNWQMINGESMAGISVLRMTEGIDDGPVLASGEFPIGARDTISDMHDRANAMFPGLVLDVLSRMDADDLQEQAQDTAQARYWHQRNDGDGRLRFEHMTAQECDRLIRAVGRPYPGAWFHWGECEVRVFAAEVATESDLRGVPGRVCWLQGAGPYVLCRDRAIILTDYSVDGAPWSDGDARLPHGVHVS